MYLITSEECEEREEEEEERLLLAPASSWWGRTCSSFMVTLSYKCKISSYILQQGRKQKQKKNDYHQKDEDRMVRRILRFDTRFWLIMLMMMMIIAVLKMRMMIMIIIMVVWNGHLFFIHIWVSTLNKGNQLSFT